MADANYVKNPSNRCYFCKHELIYEASEDGRLRGFSYVVDGNNLDDTGDYRPGRQAGRELEIRSPLIEAGLSKAEIRDLSRMHGLATWDQRPRRVYHRRIPYGSAVTLEKLHMIDQARRSCVLLGFQPDPSPASRRTWRESRSLGKNCESAEPELFDRLSREFKKNRLPVCYRRCRGLPDRRSQRSPYSNYYLVPMKVLVIGSGGARTCHRRRTCPKSKGHKNLCSARQRRYRSAS